MEQARTSRSEKEPEKVQVSGCVLDTDGNAVGGAVIAMAEWNSDNTKTATDLTRTDGSGRFQCAIPARILGRNENRVLVARATGLGADWVELRQLIKSGQQAELRLTKEVPVCGRVLTLEGKPVPGAVARVIGVNIPDGKNGLKEVYKIWPDGLNLVAHLLQKALGHQVAAGLPEHVTADTDGRFEIMGAGEGWLLTLEITADAIEHQHVRVAVDTGFDPKSVRPASVPGRMCTLVGPLYGPRFDHVARPCRVITGTVTDQQTGKPLANVGVTGRRRCRYNQQQRLVGQQHHLSAAVSALFSCYAAICHATRYRKSRLWRLRRNTRGRRSRPAATCAAADGNCQTCSK